MAFTRVKISNLYCFDDTEINLSFSRRPINSTLDYEHLEDRENFYFKKVCILSGANASGKTSFGRILLGIQIFLKEKVFEDERFRICDKNKDAYVEADFVLPQSLTLNRISISLFVNDSKSLCIRSFRFGQILIRKKESCASATKRLNTLFSNNIAGESSTHQYLTSDTFGVSSTLERFKNIFINYAWHYIFSENSEEISNFSYINKDVLSAVLKTFDNSIATISELILKNDENTDHAVEGYSIVFKNNDKVMINLEGEITNKDRLSRGTYEAVKISHMLSSVITDDRMVRKDGFICSSVYFLDEKMAFTHTELEKMIVTLIVSKLSKYSQFFYTTHNYDILNLDFPPHSFTFTKRENGVTKFIEATSICKKNDRKLQNYIKNDCFGTVPDVSRLETLLFED
ncbi:AAA family ATPase [Edaphovirga cremea]|uniref:AAA family ATPase n=1 Tax=Edaphovirga cremea TaxID=2267246 RepID=UPI003988F897